jgi:hypothetical protein
MRRVSSTEGVEADAAADEIDFTADEAMRPGWIHAEGPAKEEDYPLLGRAPQEQDPPARTRVQIGAPRHRKRTPAGRDLDPSRARRRTAVR